MAIKKIEDEVVENVVDEASLHEEGEDLSSAHEALKQLNYSVKKHGYFLNAIHPDHSYILHVRKTRPGTGVAIGEIDTSEGSNKGVVLPKWEGSDTHRVGLLHGLDHKDPKTAIKQAHGWAMKRDGLDENYDTEAAQTLQPGSQPDQSKTAMMANAMQMMAGMDKDTINKFMATLAQIGHEADMIPNDAAAKNMASIAAKMPVVAQEDFDEIFSGEELTEEFKEKASTLFEAAVNLKVSERAVELEEAYADLLEEETSMILEGLVESMDKYLTYAVNEWVHENEVAIENTLRNEINESFMNELKNVFESHYINVPEERLDVIESLSMRIDELEEAVSEQIDENIEIARAFSTEQVKNVFVEVSEGLTESQCEKLMALTENLNFNDIEDYANKLNIIKENYFSDSINESRSYASEMTSLFEENEIINEEVEEPTLQGPMASYVKTISKTIKR